MLERLALLRDRLEHARDAVASTLGVGTANFLWDPTSRETVLTHLLAWARETPEAEFIWWRGRWQTVGRFVEQVHARAAAWDRLGARPGDAVGLVFDNHLDYLHHIYALLFIGARPALINPALGEAGLHHAARAVSCRALVCEPRLREGCEGLASELPLGFFVRGDEALMHEGPPPSRYEARLNEVAAYIYTSGTTGLPKAARVKHRRFWRAGSIISGTVQFTHRDCIYCCLPLYHANASCIAVPSAILHRGRIGLAARFSARAFWNDCAESGATTFIYVGELVRYLLNRAPGADEGRHQVTRIFGNGLAADLWPQVEERFGITRIAEYYAATEGNAETINMFNRPGRMGPILPWKMAVVAWDEAAEAPERDAMGRARWVKPDEPGLLVGKISARNEFSGYGSAEATRKKVLRNLFKEGDAWFNTGDLVAYDWLVHLRFVDRIGDTFRWKSENVSTTEVAQCLARESSVSEASVYGVAIDGHEGRAGMAAIVLRDPSTFEGAFAGIFDELPRYAWPRFLRVVESLEVTGTFKHRKQELKREGWQPVTPDPLWVLDLDARRYVPLTPEIRKALAEGHRKV